MDDLILAAASAVATGLLGIAHYGFWTRHYALPHAPDEVLRPEAPGGWRLYLARYRPEPAKDLGLPVILCHGLGANRYNLDFDDRVSVARYLRARGFDCFVLELRGDPLSERLPGGQPRSRIGFDDYAALDAPAAVEAVRRATGAPRVAWVGHSMGGMVAYAHLARQAAEGKEDGGLAGLVAIASPGAFARCDHLFWVCRLTKALRALGAVYQVLPARMLAFAAGRIHPRAARLLYRPENITGKLLRRGLVNALADIPRPVAVQFADFVLEGRFTSADGRFDYLEGLRASRCPGLFIAGAKDRLGVAENVRAAYERLGGEEKEFLLYGRERGHETDYGHIDLVLGKHAPAEVFPPVAAFLERVARRTAVRV